MNPKVKSVLLALSIAGVTLSADAEPKLNVVVAVSPYLPLASRDGIARATANLLTDSPAGTKITVLNAETLSAAVRVSVRDGSKRLRQQRDAASIVAIVSLIRSATNESACFNVPVVLDHISRELRDRDAKTAVLLIGPALYRNEKEAAFDMTSAWPSDGHLAAGNRNSVFSTVERAHHLDETDVAWLVTDTASLRNEGHREGVARFWALFIANQGGSLLSYSPDVGTVFSRILEERGQLPAMTTTVDPGDTEIIMRSRKIERIQRVIQTNASVAEVRESILPERIVLPVAARASTNSRPSLALSRTVIAAQNPSSQVAVQALPAVAAGDTGIGIVWRGEPGQPVPVDLDLYVQPPNGGPELFFNCTDSIAGHFYRDLRQPMAGDSGKWQSVWEFVELRGGQLPPAVWINLYSGFGPVHGEVRLQYRGRTYARAFKFGATGGSRGAAPNGRSNDAGWVRVSISDLVSAEGAATP